MNRNMPQNQVIVDVNGRDNKIENVFCFNFLIAK